MTDEQINAWIKEQADQAWGEFERYWEKKRLEAESQGDFTKVTLIPPQEQEKA